MHLLCYTFNVSLEMLKYFLSKLFSRSSPYKESLFLKRKTVICIYRYVSIRYGEIISAYLRVSMPTDEYIYTTIPYMCQENIFDLNSIKKKKIPVLFKTDTSHIHPSSIRCISSHLGETRVTHRGCWLSFLIIVPCMITGALSPNHFPAQNPMAAEIHAVPWRVVCSSVSSWCSFVCVWGGST
jgi:hypothetical protein